MALSTRYTAEQLHVIGEAGARRIFRWMNATGRFVMSRTAYDVDPETGEPTDHLKLEQLDGSVETFDITGENLSEDAKRGDRIYVECKAYTSAGNQKKLYDEYLATSYSVFHRRWRAAQQEPALQFMWATTHPFAVTDWTSLTSWEAVRDACALNDQASRLGGEAFDEETARALAARLWVVVTGDRIDDLIMGDPLLLAMKGKMVELGAL